MTSWYPVAHRAIHKYYAGQNVDELAALLRFLDEQQPASILEIGTWEGGTAWAFAQLPSVSRIVSVDKAPRFGAYQIHLLAYPKLRLVIQDSTWPGTKALADEALDHEPADVVFIDGGHDFTTARSDFDLYSTLAKPGGLVVLHDTQGDPRHPSIEVPKLWAVLTAHYRTLELVSCGGGPFGTGIVWL